MYLKIYFVFLEEWLRIDLRLGISVTKKPVRLLQED